MIYYRLKLLFVFWFVTLKLFCQTISLGFGPIFTQSVQKVNLVNGVNDFQNTGFNLIFEYEHKLKIKNTEIFAGLNFFPGATWMAIERSKAIYEYGNGFEGLNIVRLDLGLQYKLIKLKNYYLNTGLGICMHISKRNGDDPFDSIYEIFGPDYTMTEPISINYNFFQIAPLLNIKTGFVIFKRLELFLDVKGVYGFKSYQAMNFNYSYKGIPQKTAVIEARGTGIFPSIGIGYRIVK